MKKRNFAYAVMSSAMLLGSLSAGTAAYADTGSTGTAVATPQLTGSITQTQNKLSTISVVAPSQNQVGTTGNYQITVGFTSNNNPASGEMIQFSMPGYDLTSATVGAVSYTAGTTKGTISGSGLTVQTDKSIVNFKLGTVPWGARITSLVISLNNVTNPTKAGNDTVQVADPATSAPVSAGFKVASGPAVTYSLAAANQPAPGSNLTVTAGQPFGLTVSAFDSYNNPASASGLKLITTDGNSPVGKAPDLPQSVTLSGTQATAAVTLYNSTGNTPATISLVDANGEVLSTLNNITVNPAVATLTLSGQHGFPSNTTTSFALNYADAYGNAVALGQDLTVDLSTQGNLLKFYSDASAQNQVTQVTIPAATGTAAFYAEAITSGTDALQATVVGGDPSLNPAPFAVAVDVPTIKFANSTSNEASIPVLQRIAVQVTNNSAGPGVYLQASDAQGPLGEFYGSPAGTQPFSNNYLPLAPGASATVYYSTEQTKTDAVTIAATSSNVDGSIGSATAAPLNLTVGPAAPSQVAVTSVGASINANSSDMLTAGGNGEVKVQVADQYGNPAVAGPGGLTVQLSASEQSVDSMGNTQLNPVDLATLGLPATAVIPPGQSSVPVQISSTTAGYYNIVASAANLQTDNDEWLYVGAADPTQVHVDLFPTIYPGHYEGQVMLEDQYNNQVYIPASTSLSVNLQSSNLNGVFRSASGLNGDQLDTTEPVITQAQLGLGNGGIAYFTYDEPTGTSSNTEVNASTNGLTTGAADINNPANVHLSYKQVSPDTYAATVELVGTENWLPFHPLSQDLTVTLAAPNGVILTDATGKALTNNQITIPAGQLETSFTFESESTSNFTLTATPASASGLGADQETVTPDWQSAYTVTRALQPGIWNTLSVPFGLVNPKLNAILSDNGASLEAAYTYQNGQWLQVISGKTNLKGNVINETDVLSHPLSALYLKIRGTTPVTATLAPATQPNAPATYALNKGWNLVGPSFLNLQGIGYPTDFFVGVDPTTVPLMVDPNQQQAIENPAQNISYPEPMMNGLGYWVYTTSATDTLLGQMPQAETGQTPALDPYQFFIGGQARYPLAPPKLPQLPSVKK